MLRWFGYLGLVLVGATSAVFAQQPTPAEKLAADGLAAGQRGDYDAAIDAFIKAFAADPQPRYRCNLGTAYYVRAEQGGGSSIRDYQRAQLYLGWCLDRIASAPQGMARVSGFVEARLREAGMVRVRITGQPANVELTLADLGTLTAPVTVFLPAGEHAIEARRDGYKPGSETFTLTAGQDRNVVAALEAVAAKPEPKPEPEPEPGPGPGPKPDPGDGDAAPVGPIEGGPVDSRWRRTPAYVAAGAAVAGLAVGVGFRIHAGNIVDDRIRGRDLPDNQEYRDARSDALRAFYIGVAGFAVAGVAAAASAYLFSRPEKRGRLSAGAAPTRGGAVVGFSVSL